MAATEKGTFLMFAYGSNMLTNRIRERCPSASPLGVAELHGYSLHWHKRSQDGSGKCNVMEDANENAVVFGVLHQIAADEEPALDRAEGLGHGYEKKDVEVVADGGKRRASVYCATDVDALLKPYTWYKVLVVAGAEEHGLPPSYTSRLKSTEAIQDQDLRRHSENMELVTGSGEESGS